MPFPPPMILSLNQTALIPVPTGLLVQAWGLPGSVPSIIKESTMYRIGPSGQKTATREKKRIPAIYGGPGKRIDELYPYKIKITSTTGIL